MNDRTAGIQIKVQGQVTTQFDAVDSHLDSSKRDWVGSGV
jgi:hypothetical protein